MTDFSIPLLNQGALLLRQMYRMRQDHLRRQQSCLIVDVSVRLAVRKQLVNKLNLRLVLSDVRLTGQAGLLVQVSKRLQAVHCAGGSEAGRDDWRDECMLRIDAVDVCNAGTCRFNGLRGAFIPVVLWGHRVHAYTADEGALAALETDVGEKIRGWHVDGCVVCCGGGAVGECAGYDSVVYPTGFGDVGHRAFEGEGVGVQPVKECRLAEYTGIWKLRSMSMGICILVRSWLVITMDTYNIPHAFRCSCLLLTYESGEEEAVVLYPHDPGSTPAASSRDNVRIRNVSFYKFYFSTFIYSDGTSLTNVKLLQGFTVYKRSDIDGAPLYLCESHDSPKYLRTLKC